MNTGVFFEIKLKDVMSEIASVNSELHSILKELDPPASYKLFLGEYPYGTEILKRGKFHIPIENHGMVPLNDPLIPKLWQSELNYNHLTNPVSLILHNCAEIFMLHKNTGIPITLALATPGSLISISRVLSHGVPYQPAFLWDMTAGARSLFMLPKITQQRRYRKLRAELGIDVAVPASISEHWHLFRALAQHKIVTPWQTKMLFFGKKWFENLDDPAWIKFKCFLLEKFRKTFDALGNQYIWDMVLSLILRDRDIRTSHYVMNTIKHILRICVSIMPGIAPLLDNNLGPIADLQSIFINQYQLEEYIPSILGPAYFSFYNKSPPVYYSLLYPNLLEDSPRKKDNSSVLSETYEILSLLGKFLHDLQYVDYNIHETPLYDIPKKCNIMAFHPEPHKYSKIHNSEILLREDKRFSDALCDINGRKIAEYGAILNGCFRIERSE